MAETSTIIRKFELSKTTPEYTTPASKGPSTQNISRARVEMASAKGSFHRPTCGAGKASCPRRRRHCAFSASQSMMVRCRFFPPLYLGRSGSRSQFARCCRKMVSGFLASICTCFPANWFAEIEVVTARVSWSTASAARGSNRRTKCAMPMDRGRGEPGIARSTMDRTSTTIESAPQNWNSTTLSLAAMDRSGRSPLARPIAGSSDTHRFRRVGI
jgi:hypothetical protein